MHDLVIRGGFVVDGSGAPGRVADVAIDGGDRHRGRRAAAASGRREVDANGLLVTPGFVDVHTHYDAQATWDPYLTPSSWHGVTTAVMGNCGVGFAPAAPDQHEWLIELMEGVEDIPGSALTEGIEWAWETFPEYLDALDTPPLRARHRHAGAARCRARLRDGRPRRGQRAGHRRRTSPRWPSSSPTGCARARSASPPAARRCTGRSRASWCPARWSTRPSCTASPTRWPTSATVCSSSRPSTSCSRTRSGRGCASSPAAAAAPSASTSARPTRRPTCGATCSPTSTTTAPKACRSSPRCTVARVGLLMCLEGSYHPLMFHPAYQQIAALPLTERCAALR